MLAATSQSSRLVITVAILGQDIPSSHRLSLKALWVLGAMSEPVWEFEDDVGGWGSMDEALSRKLEGAWRDGLLEVSHTVDEDVEYDFNFKDMTQTRMQGTRSGTVRRIRSVLIVNPPQDC